MKIKNLAFCGVMASILGLGGAYATDGDATIITSKAYVDAQLNTKQNHSDRVTTTWANTQTADKQSTAKYPSMATLNDVVTTVTDSISNNVTNNTYSGEYATTSNGATNITVTDVATADEAKLAKAGGIESGFNAVHDAIDNMDLTTVSATGQPIVSVGQENGKVSAQAGQITNAGVASNAAITTDKMGAITGYAISTATGTARNLSTTDTLNEALGKLEKKADDAATSAGNATDQNVYTTGLTNELMRVASAKATIAQQGTLDQAWNETIDQSRAITAGAANLYEATTNEMINADKYVPTVKAVETRITKATNDINTAVALKQNEADSNVTTAGQYILTGHNVAANLGRLDSAVGTLSTTVAGKQNSFTDGSQTGTGLVKTVAQNNGTVSAQASLGVYATDMDSALSEINTTGGDYHTNCTTQNPCVLTYMDGKYEWTTMDTDNLTGVL